MKTITETTPWTTAAVCCGCNTPFVEYDKNCIACGTHLRFETTTILIGRYRVTYVVSLLRKKTEIERVFVPAENKEIVESKETIIAPLCNVTSYYRKVLSRNAGRVVK